jgi:predicted transcriptional regulator
LSESSDRELLDLIRRRGPLTVVEMAAGLHVTGTAIRNRLARLLGAGLIERRAEHQERGRPRHTYEASALAQKRLGQNYTDLALVLWNEMMSSVGDRKLRRLLFTRVTERLAEIYRSTSGRGGSSSSPMCCTNAESRLKSPATRSGRCRCSASIPAPTTSSPQLIPRFVRSSGKCLKKCSGAACASVSVGSMATVFAISRPSRSRSFFPRRRRPAERS